MGPGIWLLALIPLLVQINWPADKKHFTIHEGHVEFERFKFLSDEYDATNTVHPPERDFANIYEHGTAVTWNCTSNHMKKLCDKNHMKKLCDKNPPLVTPKFSTDTEISSTLRTRATAISDLFGSENVFTTPNAPCSFLLALPELNELRKFPTLTISVEEEENLTFLFVDADVSSTVCLSEGNFATARQTTVRLSTPIYPSGGDTIYRSDKLSSIPTAIPKTRMGLEVNRVLKVQLRWQNHWSSRLEALSFNHWSSRLEALSLNGTSSTETAASTNGTISPSATTMYVTADVSDGGFMSGQKSPKQTGAPARTAGIQQQDLTETNSAAGSSDTSKSSATTAAVPVTSILKPLVTLDCKLYRLGHWSSRLQAGHTRLQARNA